MEFITSIFTLIGIIVCIIVLFLWEEQRQERIKDKIIIRRESPRVASLIRNYEEKVRSKEITYDENELNKIIKELVSSRTESEWLIQKRIELQNIKPNETTNSYQKKYPLLELNILEIISRSDVYNIFGENRLLAKNKFQEGLGFTLYSEYCGNEEEIKVELERNRYELISITDDLLKIGYLESDDNNENILKIGYALKASFQDNDSSYDTISWEKYIVDNNIRLLPDNKF